MSVKNKYLFYHQQLVWELTCLCFIRTMKAGKSTAFDIAETENVITVSRGIAPQLRERTAQLYDIAFGEKLALAIPNADDRMQLLLKSMRLEFAIGAFDGAQLVGIIECEL